MRLARDDKGDEAEKALEVLAKDTSGGYALLGRFRLAAQMGRTSQEEGAKAFDALASDPKVDPLVARISPGCAPRCCAWTAPTRTPCARRSSASRRRPGRGATRRGSCSVLPASRRGDMEAAGKWFDQIAADRETPPRLAPAARNLHRPRRRRSRPGDAVRTGTADDADRRHRRPAECRQVDAVQPARRQEARARRRPAGRHPRPPRGRGAARRPRASASSTPPASRRRTRARCSAACAPRPRRRSPRPTSSCS